MSAESDREAHRSWRHGREIASMGENSWESCCCPWSEETVTGNFVLSSYVVLLINGGLSLWKFHPKAPFETSFRIMFEQIAEDHDPAEGTQEIPTKDEKGKPEVVTASQVGQ